MTTPTPAMRFWFNHWTGEKRWTTENLWKVPGWFPTRPDTNDYARRPQ